MRIVHCIEICAAACIWLFAELNGFAYVWLLGIGLILAGLADVLKQSRARPNEKG